MEENYFDTTERTTGFYYQSVGYVASFLQNEVERSVFCKKNREHKYAINAKNIWRFQQLLLFLQQIRTYHMEALNKLPWMAKSPIFLKVSEIIQFRKWKLMTKEEVSMNMEK